MSLLLTTLLLACGGAAESLDQPASPPMDRIDQATVDKYTQPIGLRKHDGDAAAPPMGAAGATPSMDGAIDHVVIDNPAEALEGEAPAAAMDASTPKVVGGDATAQPATTEPAPPSP